MKTILVIEDNTIIRENIAEILMIEGYRVISEGNGKTGLAKAKQMKPDIIMCDIGIPEMNGYKVLRALKKDYSVSYIPFIFISCQAQKEDIEKGITMGADAYLTKPFGSKELLNKIENILFKKSSLRNLSPG